MQRLTKVLCVLYAFLLFMALSVPSVVYWLPVLFLTFLLAFSFLSATLAKTSLVAEQSVANHNIVRGEVANVGLRVYSKSFLPIAPVRVCIKDLQGQHTLVEVNTKNDYATYPFLAEHVGHYTPGVEYCLVSDLFHLFEYRIAMHQNMGSVHVLPRLFDVDNLHFGVGDMGALTVRRAQEDLSSPDGVRKHQMGDPLKKIHWKLSLRKQEMMVRQYEEPTLPSSLVLMDTAPPHVSQNASIDMVASFKDAVLETTASVCVHELKHKNEVKMPILGTNPFVFTSSMGEHALLERLSLVAFDETERFERAIFYEMANIKQVGAVVAITTRLSSNLVEVLSQVAGRGPVVRVYLVSFHKINPNPAYEPMLHKLHIRKVEVVHICPESGLNELHS